MKTIYVAGPYSDNPELRTREAISAAEDLRQMGFAPFVPHLFHFWHLQHPLTYEEAMTLDFAWLERCDALLRLPGVSPGATREVQYAVARGLPVFFSIGEVRAWLP